MQDMLVKLYELPASYPYDKGMMVRRIVIRRALSAETAIVGAWVAERFGAGWAGEATAALSRAPTTCFVAQRERELLGFACWDVSALGLFGPTGVDPDAHGQGIGRALVIRTLWSMREQGYGYAIIGANRVPDFYSKVCGAIPIEQSTPGVFAGLLSRAPGSS